MRIAVCDNSRESIENFERTFERINNQLNIDYDVFYSVKSLLHYIETNTISYQVYVLEYLIDNYSGIELINEIRKATDKGLIVFLTDHLQNVFEIFKVNIFDCIVKPVTVPKLNLLIDAINYYNKKKYWIFDFSFCKVKYSLYLDDIIYLKKKGRSVFIHTNTKTLIYKCNMTNKEIWEKLNPDIFVNIHISYIINLSYVKRIENDTVILTNNENLMIARKRKKKTVEKYLQYIKRICT